MTAPTDTTTPAGTVADLAADVITTAPAPTSVKFTPEEFAAATNAHAAPTPPAENLGTD